MRLRLFQLACKLVGSKRRTIHGPLFHSQTSKFFKLVIKPQFRVHLNSQTQYSTRCGRVQMNLHLQFSQHLMGPKFAVKELECPLLKPNALSELVIFLNINHGALYTVKKATSLAIPREIYTEQFALKTSNITPTSAQLQNSRLLAEIKQALNLRRKIGLMSESKERTKRNLRFMVLLSRGKESACRSLTPVSVQTDPVSTHMNLKLLRPRLERHSKEFRSVLSIQVRIKLIKITLAIMRLATSSTKQNYSSKMGQIKSYQVLSKEMRKFTTNSGNYPRYHGLIIAKQAVKLSNLE